MPLQVQGVRWGVYPDGKKVLQEKFQDVLTGEISYRDVPEEDVGLAVADYFKVKSGRTSASTPNIAALPQTAEESALPDRNVHKIACIGVGGELLDKVNFSDIEEMSAVGSLLIDVGQFWERDDINELVKIDNTLTKILMDARNRDISYVYLYD